jgi:hypothetical protein
MPLEDDLRTTLVGSLGMTLDYLCRSAPVRELFTIQELLSRHAADVAWQQSQQALGPLPKDYQEIPAVMRQQMAEMEWQQRMQREISNCTPAPYRQES